MINFNCHKWKAVAIVIALISLCFAEKLNAQQNSKAVAIGYYGNNLLNPGLELTYSKSILENTRNFAPKTDFYLDQSLAFYHDFGNHTALVYNIGFSWNRRTDKNYRWIFGVDPVGIYRSVLPRAYEVDSDGDVIKLGALAGNWYYSPGISMTYSRLNKKNELGRYYLKGEILALVPFNTFVVPLVNVGIGYQLDLKNSTDEK